MEALQGLAGAIQASAFGAWARGAWPYPLANLAHLAGMVMLVGGIGRYEDVWRMAYVRGPEGIIVSLAERIG